MKSLIILSIIISNIYTAFSGTDDSLNRLRIEEQSITNCQDYVKTHYDEVTGHGYSYCMIEIGGSNDPLMIEYMSSASKSSKEEVSFIVKSDGCVDKGDKINILFTDGERIVLYNNTSFNCKGNSMVYFGGVFGNEDQLKILTSKRIKIIRAWNNNTFIEKTLNEGQQDILLYGLKCLIK